jgi:hypothetical protein
MYSKEQQQEERALVDAAERAERHSYAISMAAVVKSLTSAEPATAQEIAAVKAAEAGSRAANKALEDYQRCH